MKPSHIEGAGQVLTWSWYDDEDMMIDCILQDSDEGCITVVACVMLKLSSKRKLNSYIPVLDGPPSKDRFDISVSGK